MTTYDEGKIRFGFNDRWLVEKWDASRVYANGIGKLSGPLEGCDEGTKAVDFVGVENDTLYFFEVKDFRGHRIENAKRQHRELALEIGLKVRDTLAGIVGAYARTGSAAWIERCGEVLAQRRKRVHVVVWIADDPPGPREPQSKRDEHNAIRRKLVEQKLAWLTSRVRVEEPLATTLPGVTAESLPGAGRG